MSRHNKKDLLNEVDNCGIPIARDILQIIREEIDKIEWAKTYEMVDYAAVMAIWKAVLGSSFRPLFFSIIHRLLTEIDPKKLEQYLKDPNSWNINIYATRLKRRRHE